MAMNIRLSLLVLSLAFLAGAIGGNLTAMLLADGGSLAAYAEALLDGAHSGTLSTAFTGTLLTGLFIPLVIFLSGFSSLGVGIIPMGVALKGFTFSYAVSALFRALGPGGVWFTVCALGVANLPYIPCLLFSALFAFRSSAAVASVFFGKRQQSGTQQSGTMTYRPFYFIQFAVSFTVMSGLSAYQAFLQPHLLTLAAGSVR